MYNGGLKDNKFNIIHNANSSVKIVVKTPVGKTNQESIQNVIIQGDVLGPMLCSNTIDTFGKECLTQKKYTFLYKGEVEIPPLSMVDDIICVSECGYKSVMINSFLNSKTSMKKMQFGASKCRKMHIGKIKEDFKCHPIFVDNWKEKDVRNETGKEVIEDIFVGKVMMEEAEDEKYLGDIISRDGKNIKNIKARVNKGKGIVKKILDILETIPFGKLYFTVAIILRNSLLVSSVLCNSEAWFNITKTELDLIETVDLMLLRSLLRAPKSVPKEILFLELGVLPLRDLIMQRRLNFLYYILTQRTNSIIFQIFETQNKYRSKTDWVTTVEDDLKYLGLNLTFENIQKLSKTKWKNMVRNMILQKTFTKLENTKQTHSKVKSLKHIRIEMQDYLMPNDVHDMNKEDAQMIFQIRSKVMDLKMNMKGNFEKFECSVCLLEEETQEHVYQCKQIWKMKKKIDSNIPNYEEILWGNVMQKLKVARILKENMKIREQYKT